LPGFSSSVYLLRPWLRPVEFAHAVNNHHPRSPRSTRPFQVPRAASREDLELRATRRLGRSEKYAEIPRADLSSLDSRKRDNAETPFPPRVSLQLLLFCRPCLPLTNKAFEQAGFPRRGVGCRFVAPTLPLCSILAPFYSHSISQCRDTDITCRIC